MVKINITLLVLATLAIFAAGLFLGSYSGVQQYQKDYCHTLGWDGTKQLLECHR